MGSCPAIALSMCLAMQKAIIRSIRISLGVRDIMRGEVQVVLEDGGSFEAQVALLLYPGQDDSHHMCSESQDIVS